MAGLRSWRSHVPAVLYVTAPYVMTNIYIRQDLTESAATASIPLLLASGLSVLRADRLRAGPVAALAVSTITLGGSHNLTLLWGTTILGLTAIALAAAVPQVRDMVTRRGLLRVLAIVVPAMAVNAWYLLPDLAYHSHTVIAHRVSEWRDLLGKPGPLVEAKYLFSPGRSSPFPGSGLTVALPVLTIAWLAIAAVAARARWREPWARTLAVLALASAVVLVVMVHPGLITGLPDPWLMLQFSYRLESFVLFGISGATIAALVLLDHTNNRWSAALLIPIAAFSTFGAARQMHGAPRAKADFAWTIDNFSAFSMGDFADPTLTQRPPVGNTRLVRFLRSDVKHDHIDATIAAQPGDVVYTDLMSLPQMVDVQGARVIGGWALPPLQRNWQGRWSLVLQIDEDATPGKAHLVVREARTLPIVGGRIISILGLLGLTTVAGVIARAGVLRRRRGER
jgi:hypothetical protein